MSKRNILFLWLQIFVISILAQQKTLTIWEYWFDDSYDMRKSANLTGNQSIISKSLNVVSLRPGTHLLNYRIKESNVTWSPTDTNLFIKLESST